MSIATTLNRRRLALSVLIFGAFLVPSVAHKWSIWAHVPYAFYVAERDEAFREAEDKLIASRGITRQEYDAEMQVKCERAYENEPQSYRDDPLFGINGCLHNKTWGGELPGTFESYKVGVIATIRMLSPFSWAVVIGAFLGAIVGYLIPSIIYVTTSFVPNTISAYVRWLHGPQR